MSFFGDGIHRDGLTRFAEDLGLERVSFEGQTSDIAGIWRHHQALVLPSRAEGLPLTVVEAMMCGRPVIVTDVGGSAELVEDGRTGFVADAPSVGSIDEALGRAWERRGEWPDLGRAAAIRIRELVGGDPARDLADRLLLAAGSG